MYWSDQYQSIFFVSIKVLSFSQYKRIKITSNELHLPNHQRDQGNHDLLWHQADQSFPGIPEDHWFQEHQEDPKQPQGTCQWIYIDTMFLQYIR